MENGSYVMTFLTGSVELGRPTGRWIQDPDGGCREVYTPTRWLDASASAYREEPCDGAVRIFGPVVINGRPCEAPRQRGLWDWLTGNRPEPRLIA